MSESSSGGLISAVLLAVPGASAYFMGGAVVYTRPAGEAFLTATPSKRSGIRSSSEPWATLAGRLSASGSIRPGASPKPVHRPDRQFLRRPRRSHLRRGRRPQRQDRTHPAHRLERSGRQHARLRRRALKLMDSSCPSEPERAARSGSCPRRCRARHRCRHRR